MPSTATPGAAYMTADDVAEILNIPRKSVYDLVHERGLPVYRVGPRRFRFLRHEIDAWIAGASTARASPPCVPLPPAGGERPTPPPPVAWTQPRVTRRSIKS